MSSVSRFRTHLLNQLACLYVVLCIHTTAALTISPPSSASDYWQLASLLVSTFDAPVEDVNRHHKSLQSKLEVLKWNMIEKPLTEESTYKQYASTARKMRGKKYCLLVAKEFLPDEEGSLRDVVVGMVEMGLSLCPVSLHQEVGTLSGGERKNIDSVLRPQPTLGVLCVKRTNQQQGVGRLLVEKCEQVAAEVWSMEQLFVDVEPDNQNALSFFETCGYNILVNELEELQMRNATVVRRRVAEKRPHYLLSKRLPQIIAEEKTISDED